MRDNISVWLVIALALIIAGIVVAVIAKYDWPAILIGVGVVVLILADLLKAENGELRVNEAMRAWIYRVSLAVLPLLIVFGVVQKEDAALWVALAGAVLNTGLASANTSTSSTAK
jgi:hypothetical protein